MEFKMSTTSEAFVEACIYRQMQDKAHARRQLIVMMIRLAGVFVVGYVIFKDFPAPFVWVILMTGLYAALTLPFRKKLVQRGIRRRFENDIAAGKFGDFPHERTLSFEENGLCAVNAFSNTVWPYESITSVMSDGMYINLDVETTGPVLLPHASFASEDEAQRFLALLWEKMDPPAQQ